MEDVVCGVQAFVPGSRTPEELRADRRRAAAEIGLLRLERESPSVLVGRRRIKAWRVRGTPEFALHARMVALLAEEFSGGES